MFTTILIVTCIAGSLRGISAEKIEQSNSIFRIINGISVSPGEIPYQASMQIKSDGRHMCGGVIITEYYVLTAAHCIYSHRPAYHYAAKDIRVIVGAVVLWHPIAGHDVTRTIIHENYDAPVWKNDIALLEVDEPIRFNAYVAPATLPHSDDYYKFFTQAEVSGYGETEKVRQSPQLLRANVLIVNMTECQAAYDDWGHLVGSMNICSKGVGDNRGFCNGDSGGPLSINGTVIGIVSWSLNYGCYQNGHVQVYTRIANYIHWISWQIRRKVSCSFDATNRLYVRDEF